jgi:hypothetical protein
LNALGKQPSGHFLWCPHTGDRFRFTAKLLGGTLDWKKNPATSENIIGAAWFSQADMEDKIIFPTPLRHEYWLDRGKGFITPRFLGIRQVTFRE